MKGWQKLVLDGPVQRMQRGYSAYPAAHGLSRPFLYTQIAPHRDRGIELALRDGQASEALTADLKEHRQLPAC